VANNVCVRTVVGCRNGTAGSFHVQDEELYFETALDICAAVLPERTSTVNLKHRM
jgi:hypothetical protein